MSKSITFLLTILMGLNLFQSCTRNAITGRKQLSLYPEAELQSQAVMTYRNFLSENKVITPVTSKDAQMVKRVGNNIQQAITRYYTDKSMSDHIKDYSWEFNVKLEKLFSNYYKSLPDSVTYKKFENYTGDDPFYIRWRDEKVPMDIKIETIYPQVDVDKLLLTK